jgi:hypothetical protein
MSDPLINYQNIVGTWISDPYRAAFPKSNKLYPSGNEAIVMKLVVFKQDNNQLWANNYWKFINDTRWYQESATGFIMPNNTIKLVEDDPKPFIGSSGVFTLTPVIGKMISNFYDKYNVYYEGIGKGISFTTTLKYQSKSVDDITPLVNIN